MPERSIIFYSQLLKFSQVLIKTHMSMHVPTVQFDNTIWFRTLSRISRLLSHSCKWASWFGRFLQYTSGLEVLPCSLDTDLDYAPTEPFLEPKIKVATTFRGKQGIKQDFYFGRLFSREYCLVCTTWALSFQDAATFWAYSLRQIPYPSSTLSWIRDPLLNFQQNV